ncbi:MAG: UDP-N-acetylmuramoyl-tripeptide--D-alanyl-D-alanine ligase [Candidatus Kerfeldbacteria bacterium]|nr:UDP-N-acetylmuramoyl-tripeptide--D-alanyl-D-alanine ligase [Candidatus Kerfeldbacteria bacterium]
MRRLAYRLLRVLARRVIQRYHPDVIGVTGSYGKTSAKEAIEAVLASAYVVRSSAGSFNNEFGLPFTVLGVSPHLTSGFSRGLQAAFNGLRLLLTRQPYPTALVLEMGADRPGDIRDLVQLTHLNVGVLTGVGATHLQRFGTVDAVLAEKSLLVTAVSPRGWAVLNGDDVRARTLAEVAPARIISYGFDGGCAVRAIDAAPSRDQATGEWGILVKIEFNQQRFAVFLPGVAGRHSVYAALAGVAVGAAYHLDVVEIVSGLRRYVPPAGRMRVLAGAFKTTLIDDSYNASPDAAVAAIEALRQWPTDRRRWAVLGDMAELGTATEPAHRAVGTTVANERIDELVVVGEHGRATLAAAVAQGLPADRVHHFTQPAAAAAWLRERVQPGDVLLLKGSQASRMEKVVKALLADQSKAGELLVRQYGAWLSS